MSKIAELYKDPIPGVAIFPPDKTPYHDDILLGYEYSPAPARKFGIFCKPDPTRITARGWLGILVAGLVFWPVSPVPCCLTCSYQSFQRPVYGPAP